MGQWEETTPTIRDCNLQSSADASPSLVSPRHSQHSRSVPKASSVPTCPPVLMTIAAVSGEQGVRATGSGATSVCSGAAPCSVVTPAKRQTLWPHFPPPALPPLEAVKVRCLELSPAHSKCSVNESFPTLFPNRECSQDSSL